MMMNFDEGGKRAIADLSISDCRFQIADFRLKIKRK